MLLIEESAGHGDIDAHDHQLLARSLELSGLTAADAMTVRRDIVAVAADATNDPQQWDRGDLVDLCVPLDGIPLVVHQLPAKILLDVDHRVRYLLVRHRSFRVLGRGHATLCFIGRARFRCFLRAVLPSRRVAESFRRSCRCEARS